MSDHIPHRQSGSPFYNPPAPVGDPTVIRDMVKPQPPSVPSPNDGQGPKDAELEEWYQKLQEALQAPGEFKDVIEDVRDAIYKYLH